MSSDESSNKQTPVTPVTSSTAAVTGQHAGSTESAQTDKTTKISEQPPGQNVVASEIVEKLSGHMTHDVVTREWYQRNGNIFTVVPDAKARLIVRNKLRAVKLSIKSTLARLIFEK